MIRQSTHRLFVATSIALGFVMLFHTAPQASGPICFYGILDKVVFEPNDTQPDRVQVWGVFAVADQQGKAGAPARGYLYLRLPSDRADLVPPRSDVARREWNDLKAVAGTGQAVGFGSAWAFPTPERIRPASERPSAPVEYVLNTGVVKLSANGSNTDILNQLRAVAAR